MRREHRDWSGIQVGGGILGTAVLVVGLSGCTSEDRHRILWGAEAGEVINTTLELRDAIVSGDEEQYVCEGATPELRDRAIWEGLLWDDPEEYSNPSPETGEWFIGLSLPEGREVPGAEYPSALTYNWTEDGLCLLEVTWSVVEG